MCRVGIHPGVGHVLADSLLPSRTRPAAFELQSRRRLDIHINSSGQCVRRSNRAYRVSVRICLRSLGLQALCVDCEVRSTGAVSFRLGPYHYLNIKFAGMGKLRA